VRPQRKNLPNERLLTFMKNRQPGRTFMKTIAREFAVFIAGKLID
jgi:hypothetical protein